MIALLPLLLLLPVLGSSCPSSCSCPSPSHLSCSCLTSPLPPIPCTRGCAITHLSLSSSLLPSLTTPWLDSLGVCPSSLLSLTVTNSSLGSVSLSLPSLQTLDLRENTGVGSLHQPRDHNITSLYLSGNSWPCIVENSTQLPNSKSTLAFGQQMAWLLAPPWSSSWLDKESTYCGRGRARGQEEQAWYNKGKEATTVRDSPRSVLSFLHFSQRTLSSCPPFCVCVLASVAVSFFQQGPERDLKVSVLCRDLGLTQLPLTLPPDTIYLDLTNNKISSLSTLGSRPPDYRLLEGLTLTNNSLTSLEGLRASWLVKGTRLLDLHNNQLRYLNTLVLEPLLASSLKPQGNESLEAKFYLAGNPWTCNCHTVLALQDFIGKYNNIIMDAEEVECYEFSGESLLHLDYKVICPSSTKLDPMVVVILLEVMLLTGIMAKLTWDCIMYRRTGQLPWIARKMCCSVPGLSVSRPRLPLPLPRSRLPTLCGSSRDSPSEGGGGEVKKGSSGYITSSTGSSNQHMPGGRETSVVRFI